MADPTGFPLKDNATHDATEHYERYSAPLMAPFVTEVIEATDLFPGAHVLDLACGTGFVARAAAAQVGPTGHVAAADLLEAMLKTAARHAPRMYPDIEFTQAPADKLPYPDDSFDAVLCQQGVQFFPDLDTALAEAARVTRPGGRFTATAWTPPADRNPYMAAHLKAVTELGNPEARARFGVSLSVPADRLTAALTTAGFHDITTREVTFGIALPDLADFVTGHLAAVPWGQSIEEASGPTGFAEAARAIREALTPYAAPDGSATLPFTSTLATATRSTTR
ncbi:class I SAM-dependent methyltransferase [Streptomyces turgidiscabies]|uniref:Methyltransferase domain protein n=1 Tax=Streptomyces turgidiscabies (strain Car8) TaxID=698760 RepID=L7FEN2_STRT8|nr:MULTISPECIES: methyltransferase domain-containing protein [Streptomyces]ELP69115.1 methyltransferase domain protein [Streptomyces turgidiscabies Car8]MDX3499373.1 methyltransferase domain-containing protein [Streptomyces turgidiscabies]GAQ77500.1 ubiquinone/menaquinone biosynthesis methyltransferase [Streptomyces turgidiscabies]